MTPIRDARIAAAGFDLECRWWGEAAAGPPVVVLLHEGLGCVGMWRSWPAELAAACGLPVLAYSRAGYGSSDPVPLPRPLEYMQIEGREVLPMVLEAAGIDDAILVGHSDGASIALIHAGAHPEGVRALTVMAPHVFCEAVSVESIRQAGVAFRDTDLRVRLARYHGDNVEVAFRGWHDAWLDPGFRDWNIEAFLPAIRVPVLVIQGADDQYGTLAQVEAIETGVAGPVDRVVLQGCGHSPYRERPEETLEAVVAFLGERRGGDVGADRPS